MKQLDIIQNNIAEVPNGIENREKDSSLPSMVPKITL